MHGDKTNLEEDTDINNRETDVQYENLLPRKRAEITRATRISWS